MNNLPLILLTVGSIFALLYAATIIIGWAHTRRNRRQILKAQGLSRVPVMLLDPTIQNPPTEVVTFSLTDNQFVDNQDRPIDMTQYQPFIAVGESPSYPQIHHGNLLLKDATGTIRYIFQLPDLSQYR